MPETEQVMEAPEAVGTLTYPVKIFRLIDQRGSGFIKQGTENTPEPEERSSPSVRSVLKVSSYRDGDKNIRIRYISGCDTIIPEEQEKFGFATVGGGSLYPHEDEIPFKWGLITVERSGSTIGLFDYLSKSSLNKNSTARIPNMKAIWEEVDQEAKIKGVNDNELEKAQVITWLGTKLIKSRTDSEVFFDEDLLNSLCSLFHVSAETQGGKFYGLVGIAKINPADFKKKATDYVQSVVTQIMVAEELGLIAFSDRSCYYTADEKPITTFSDKLKSKEKKVEFVATFFRGIEGREEYREFLVHLDGAKEKGASK